MTTENNNQVKSENPHTKENVLPQSQTTTTIPMKSRKLSIKMDEYNKKCEHISEVTGSWGPFQKRLFLMLSVMYLVAPLHNNSLVFYATKTPFTCTKPLGLWNITEKECPLGKVDQCLHFEYEGERRTIVTEWNLVCDRTWLISAALASYQIGYAISGIVIGIISDKYGRKTALITSIVLEILSSIASCLVDSIYAFITMRLILGIAGFGRYLASLIIFSESCGPKIRPRIIVLFDIVWNMSMFVTIILAYYINDFRQFFIIPILFEASMLLWIKYVPESPRWQIVNNQFEGAKHTIVKFTRDYRRESLVIDQLKELSNHLNQQKITSTKPTIWDIWSRWILLKNTLILYAIWFFIYLSNFGMTFLLLDFAGSVYVNYGIMNLSSLIANLMLGYLINRFKRRTLYISILFITTVMLFCLAPICVSPDYHVLRTIVLLIGRIFANQLWGCNYVYTPEIFPTSVRHLGIGSCSVVGRIASVLSPFVLYMAKLTSMELVIVVFALFTLIGTILAYFLPETKDKEIPDTIEQMISNFSDD